MQVLVVVPTLNERANLPPLVREILSRGNYQVLIVDDRSPDGTGDAADALSREFPDRVACLHRDGPRGLGAAYAEGFIRALAGPADLICQMDADRSHAAADLPRLIAAARDFDLVIGSRYVAGAPRPGLTGTRLLLSRAGNAYVRRVLRLPQRDCTSGFRCWRRQALAAIGLDRLLSRGYAFQVELLAEAVRAGHRITEVPIRFDERIEGVSKMSARVIAESALMPWRLRMRARAVSSRTRCVAVGGGVSRR